MRPLIIGQAPGPNTDPREPLSGRCGARLADLCGLSVPEFMMLFDRINLIYRFPGKAGKGDHFPIHVARRRAIWMMMQGRLSQGPVILLGQKVADVFRFRCDPVMTMIKSPVAPHGMAMFPHPSGVSRWWNEPRNVADARRCWRRLALDALAAELRPGEPCPGEPRRPPAS